MTTAVGSKTSYSKLDKLLEKAETKRKREEDKERREEQYIEPEGFAKELTYAYIEKLHEHVTGHGLITNLRRSLDRGD